MLQPGVLTASEIAKELGLTLKQLRECLERSRRPMSLDMRVGEHKDTDLVELIEDPKSCSEERLVQEDLTANLSELLETLTLQQQEILLLRFGLRGEEPLSLTEIGDRFGLSRERIRQIERKALKELRQRFSQQDRSGVIAEADDSVHLELLQRGDGQDFACREFPVSFQVA